MKKNIKNLLYIVCLIAILVLPYFVFASSPISKLQSVGRQSGYQPNTDSTTAVGIAGTVVNVFFSILGVIFLILMLYGGYNWMIAGGDNSKVEKAKDTIKRAVIGLIIIISAWVITAFVTTNLFSTAFVVG